MKDEPDLDIEDDIWQARTRTELAWSRSGLSVLAVVLLLARRLTTVVTTAEAQLLGLALLVIVGAAIGLFVVAFRGDREHQIRRRERQIAMGTTALAAVGLVLALFPPSS
jgi:uncharacterized membrane protein YidH (DUF202 family)